MGFDVVYVERTKASEPNGNSDACSRIEIDLDRLELWDNHDQSHVPNATEHDSNEINCPSSMSTARLTDVWLQLDIKPSDQYQRKSPRARHAVIVAMVDAALRDLICQSLPRLAAGVRRWLPYASNLQDVFPAIFSPGRSKAISVRLRLISSISQSIIKCKTKSKGSLSGYTRSAFAEALAETPGREDVDDHREGLQHSLFMSLVRNTGNTKGAKALRSLTANDLRDTSSINLSELPENTDNLSLFHPPNTRSGASSISLFFEDNNETDQDTKVCKSSDSPGTTFEVATDVTDEHADIIRASPPFEDLTLSKPCNGGKPLGDYSFRDVLAITSCREASACFSPPSKSGEPQQVPESEIDVSMLREPFALAEEAEAPFGCCSSAEFDVIGEGDKLTQSCIHNSPRDDCSIRTTSIPMEEIPYTVTASSIQQGDEATIEPVIDDLFTSDICQVLPRSISAKSPLTVDTIEVFDDHSSTPSSEDLELDSLSQVPQTPMNDIREENLTLAELLGDAKFSPEMWARRRSTVMHSIPSTYVPGSSTRSLGSGWSLKPSTRETNKASSPPTTAFTNETRQPTIVEEDHRPIFSKRSSTSSSSPAPHSPHRSETTSSGQSAETVVQRLKDIIRPGDAGA